MDVSTNTQKTSPHLKAKKQAYIEGLQDAQKILRASTDMVDQNKRLGKKIVEETRELRKM